MGGSLRDHGWCSGEGLMIDLLEVNGGDGDEGGYDAG